MVSHNLLMLNSLITQQIVSLDGIILAPGTTVRNLGVIFDQELSFISHVELYWYQISRTTFFHLLNIAKIQYILSQQDEEKLVHVFLTFKLYYYNSSFSGCPDKIFKKHNNTSVNPKCSSAFTY